MKISDSHAVTLTVTPRSMYELNHQCDRGLLYSA
jgi:hypothetical protein